MEIKDVKFIKSFVEYEKEMSPLFDENAKWKILFLGRSNVWKSSIINSLMWKKDLAYSWAKAGKTRTINIFEVNKKYECLDFPGYWFSVGNKKAKINLRDMVLAYLEQNYKKNIKAVLIVDGSIWPTNLDEEIYSYLHEKWVDIQVILNKVDKVNQKELEQIKIKTISALMNAHIILYSCKNDSKYRDNALNKIFN